MPPPAKDNAAVVRRLIDHLRRHGLRAGDRLPSIRDLAGEFGVKPNVVRDALLHAQTLGMVRVLPRSGAFVQSLDITPLGDALADTLHTTLAADEHNLFHVIDARAVLEVELAGRAAGRRTVEDLLPLHQSLIAQAAATRGEDVQKCDFDFHLGLARLAGNPVLVGVLKALHELVRPYNLRTHDGHPRRRRLTLTEHRAVYAAVLAGDAAAAQAAMRTHLAHNREQLLEVVRLLPPVGEPPVTPE